MFVAVNALAQLATSYTVLGFAIVVSYNCTAVKSTAVKSLFLCITILTMADWCLQENFVSERVVEVVVLFYSTRGFMGVWYFPQVKGGS